MPNFKKLLESTTNRLIAINVLVFFVMQNIFGDQRSGFELAFWLNPDFEIWQIVSSTFLHGGLGHLAFNMLALWSFGRVLERVFGGRRFLIFYLACGVGASLLHLAVSYYQFQIIYQQLISIGFSDVEMQNAISTFSVNSSSVEFSEEIKQQFYDLWSLYGSAVVGASGSIYGVLVAFALLFPNFKIVLLFLPVPIAAKYFVPVLLLIDLTAGLTGITIFGNNIAHFAHIGGAIIGFILVQYWLKQRQ